MDGQGWDFDRRAGILGRGVGDVWAKVQRWEEAGIVRCPENSPARQEAQRHV